MHLKQRTDSFIQAEPPSTNLPLVGIAKTVIPVSQAAEPEGGAQPQPLVADGRVYGHADGPARFGLGWAELGRDRLLSRWSDWMVAAQPSTREMAKTMQRKHQKYGAAIVETNSVIRSCP